ncbi:MAG: hypothetical protein SFW35_06030 [Chitinophagales bacterium]|nr:hypothetical protein [Chitinophagales bacterium]
MADEITKQLIRNRFMLMKGNGANIQLKELIDMTRNMGYMTLAEELEHRLEQNGQ